MPRACAVAIVAIAALIFVPAAFAASVKLSGSQILYTAGAGEVNRVGVTQPAVGTFTLTDNGVGSITDGDGLGGCSVLGNVASCLAAGVNAFVIKTLDQDDTVSVDASMLIVTNDVIEGGDGADQLTAGDGNDTLRGGNTADTLKGLAGDDMLDGGAGPDVMYGGAGVDRALYGTRTAAVKVSINNVADDGDATDGSATRDDVRTDVEEVLGGA